MLARRRPGAHQVALRGRAQDARRPTAPRPGPARSPRACPGPRPARRRAAARPRRTPPGPGRGVDAALDRHRAQGLLMAASTTASTSAAVTPARASARGGRRDVEPAQAREAPRRPGCARPPGRRRSPSARCRPGRSRPGRAPRPRCAARPCSAPPASTPAIDPPPAPMVCTSSDGTPHREPADQPLGGRLRPSLEHQAHVGAGAAHVEGDRVGQPVGLGHGRRRPAPRPPARDSSSATGRSAASPAGHQPAGRGHHQHVGRPRREAAQVGRHTGRR